MGTELAAAAPRTPPLRPGSSLTQSGTLVCAASYTPTDFTLQMTGLGVPPLSRRTRGSTCTGSPPRVTGVPGRSFTGHQLLRRKDKGTGSTGHGTRCASWARPPAWPEEPTPSLARTLPRVRLRRGKKGAIVAVARCILDTVWHLLWDPDARFSDAGPDQFSGHIRQLEAFGFTVTLTPAARNPPAGSPRRPTTGRQVRTGSSQITSIFGFARGPVPLRSPVGPRSFYSRFGNDSILNPQF
jgi:hypothetical protein